MLQSLKACSMARQGAKLARISSTTRRRVEHHKFSKIRKARKCFKVSKPESGEKYEGFKLIFVGSLLCMQVLFNLIQLLFKSDNLCLRERCLLYQL